MKRVEAQFRPHWRPGRIALAALATFAVCAALAVGAAAWEHQRVSVLRTQIAQLIEDEHNGVRPPAPLIAPAYDASARQFLRERGAGWASMLRTLESGSMIGVTPSSVEFNAADGSARVELNYSDSTALFDYLGRINEGVSPRHGLARWTLVETRVQPDAGASNGPLPGNARVGGAVASIRSSWLDPAAAGSQAGAAP
jgi:hypothetical protein